MGMKVEALRVQAGKTLISLENGSMEALKRLVEIRISLDSLINQVADSKYYDDEDKKELDIVRDKIVENLEEVVKDYK